MRISCLSRLWCEASDAQGNPLGVVDLPLDASFDGGLCLAFQGLGMGAAHAGARMELFAQGGEPADSGMLAVVRVLDPEIFGAAEGGFHAGPNHKAYAIEACSMALMPDYGGAAFWLPSGANADLGAGHFTAGPEEAGLFQAEVGLWQRQFEWRVDDGCSPSACSPAPFEWAAFNSKALAIALRSRAVLRSPLRVDAAFECRDLSAGPAKCWPAWGAGCALESEACEALERLDQGGFARALANGAVQSIGADMPWEVYCAHWRLDEALGLALASARGRPAQACGWGCSALDAALFALHPPGIEIALGAAPRKWIPWAGTRWAQMAPFAEPGAVEACLEALARAGVEPGWEGVGALRHSASLAMAAHAEARCLDRQAMAAKPPGPKAGRL